jgi:hypothetical protein
LARNTTLTSLAIYVSGNACLRELGAMPSIEVFNIRIDSTTSATPEDARLISTKRLRSLAFGHTAFSPSAWAVVASANASSLHFRHCGLFGKEAIDALLANSTLTSLQIDDLEGAVARDDAEKLARKPTLNSLHLNRYVERVNDERSLEYDDVIQNAWGQARKQPHKLFLRKSKMH